jgi:hypothetical protein
MALCEEFEEECCVSLAQTTERHVCKTIESLTFSSFLSAGLVVGAVRGV